MPQIKRLAAWSIWIVLTAATVIVSLFLGLGAGFYVEVVNVRIVAVVVEIVGMCVCV